MTNLEQHTQSLEVYLFDWKTKTFIKEIKAKIIPRVGECIILNGYSYSIYQILHDINSDIHIVTVYVRQKND